MAKFQSPTGMRDLLEEELKAFQNIEKASEDIAEFYNFRKIETPILEESALFEKGTGQTTDIVQKEMFQLRTKGGDCLTLRPEGTPSVIRAYLERGMENDAKPVKLWHFGPFFRYERPQAGRYRQFWQAGFEMIGSDSWINDAQIILIFYKILESLGLKNLNVEINSVGDFQCRPYYKKILLSFLRARRNSLCANCRRRIRMNPLRVLDCKEEKCRSIIRNGAPQILDHLCKECSEHFRNVLESLEELAIPYALNPYLVRGLDYYTKTVFEIVEAEETGEQEKTKPQGTIVSGGRYDSLVKLLGGKDNGAVGGAMGVDRTANLLGKALKKLPKVSPPKIFLAQVGEFPKRKALKLFEDFRKEKLKVCEALDKNSLSLQLKLADKMGVEYVLILGQKEALEEQIIIRDMKTGDQKTIAMARLLGEMKRRLKKT